MIRCTVGELHPVTRAAAEKESEGLTSGSTALAMVPDMILDLLIEPYFSHIGMYKTIMQRMELIYCDVLGFCATDRLRIGELEMVFLSRSLEEHRPIVLSRVRIQTSYSTISLILHKLKNLIP